MEKKGKVVELSSLYPAEEAQKASKRVQGAVAERQQQLNQVKSFISDNISLINLVKKLPDETHHNIMVPFGKAAFFPGRLIHTNEFMVLLGEGYYAERTSKQTIEILKRRGKSLETHAESLKAIMQDLNAEASFFDDTANESAEGLVEIREDYVEEGSAPSPMTGYSKSDNNPPLKGDEGKATTEDEEYARIFARMAELEKEEEEAEKADESDDDQEPEETEKADESDDEDQETEEEAEKANESNDDEQVERQISTDQEVRSTLVEIPETLTISKGKASHGDNPTLNNSVTDKASELPQEVNKIQPSFPASTTAFTGTIVERAQNFGANLPGQQTDTRRSKPVSRFMMQRKQ